MIFNLGGGSAAPQLTDIAVTTKPTKTAYEESETFSTSGMVVTAYFDDGTNAEVTAYTYSPTTVPAGTSNITISYTHDDVTKSTTVSVTGRRWLYKNGNECTNITGGWVAGNRKAYDGISGGNPEVLKYGTYMAANFYGAKSNTSGQAITTHDINLAPFKTLTAVFQSVSVYGSYSGLGVAVGDRSKNPCVNSAYKGVVSHNNYSNPDISTEYSNRTVTLDVSSVNASLAVYLQLIRAPRDGYSGSSRCELSQMYLT